MPDELTKRIIGAAVEVHRHLGPGFLESIYEEALTHELGLRQIKRALLINFAETKLVNGIRRFSL